MSSNDDVVDRLLGDVQKFYRDTSEKATGGKSVRQLASGALMPVMDEELNAKNELFFNTQKTIREILSTKESWVTTMGALSETQRRTSALYMRVFPEGHVLHQEANQFNNATTGIDRAKKAILEGTFAGFLNMTFAPLGQEMKALDIRRLAVHKLQYRVEQLEKAYADEHASKVLSLARGDRWLENGREELAIVKPAFYDAMNDFMQRFREQKSRCAAIWKEDSGKYNQAVSSALSGAACPPPSAALDFMELDRTLSVLRTTHPA